MALSYILGNRNPKKLLIFQEVTFHARKVPTLKKFLIFQELSCKPQNQKFPILFLIKKQNFIN